ncbi:hypothetical protein FOWG_17793 [Fusarium oxysporum f. sp. lycopersici MN25]|nr:hypothetical protein FOWG_17793 [Fusarium oxysporum f. sp. lycopersici MN25]
MQAPVLPVEFYDPSSKRHLIVTSIHISDGTVGNAGSTSKLLHLMIYSTSNLRDFTVDLEEDT